ncbi:MAG: hypothetical protein WA947_01655 [Phormidesmis sp.]
MERNIGVSLGASRVGAIAEVQMASVNKRVTLSYKMMELKSGIAWSRSQPIYVGWQASCLVPKPCLGVFLRFLPLFEGKYSNE